MERAALEESLRRKEAELEDQTETLEQLRAELRRAVSDAAAAAREHQSAEARWADREAELLQWLDAADQEKEESAARVAEAERRAKSAQGSGGCALSKRSSNC